MPRSEYSKPRKARTTNTNKKVIRIFGGGKIGGKNIYGAPSYAERARTDVREAPATPKTSKYRATHLPMPNVASKMVPAPEWGKAAPAKKKKNVGLSYMKPPRNWWG